MKNSNEINWYHDFIYSEIIHDLVIQTIGTSSRLRTNYPYHPDSEKWKLVSDDICKFDNKRPNLKLKSELEAKRLIKKLQRTLKPLLDQETRLHEDFGNPFLRQN